MTALRQTSLLALEQFRPKLPRAQRAVYDQLCDADPAEGMTDGELKHALGWEINRITPRRGELVKATMVEVACVRTCKANGTKATAWRIRRD